MSTSESLTITVARHLETWHREDPHASWPTIATLIREQHEALVPEAQRTIEWSANKDAHKRMRLDAQILRRDHLAEHELPADLVPAVVAALPADRHRRLLAAVAAHFHLFPAELPDAGREDEDVAHAGELASRFGELMQTLGPILADGRICEADGPHARDALLTGRMLVGAVLSTLRRIETVAPAEAKHLGRIGECVS